MKRPIVIALNAPAKSSRVWTHSPFHGMRNIGPMPEPVLPNYPETREVDGNFFEQNTDLSLKVFWQQQMNEMSNFTGFKSQNHLPLARVKKIMKSDAGVKMISADAPPVFAKACEMFILEMTLLAWMQTESRNRRTIQRSDIAEAVNRCDVYDFLIDLFPSDADPNAVQEQIAPAAADPFVSPFPDMNFPVDHNLIEQNLEVPPEVMADSFVANDPFDIKFALP